MQTKDMVLGALAGAGAVIAAPYVLPIVSAIARPLVRESIKQAIVVSELARVHGAVVLEALEDVIAEAREDARIALEAARSKRDERQPHRKAEPAVASA